MTTALAMVWGGAGCSGSGSQAGGPGQHGNRGLLVTPDYSIRGTVSAVDLENFFVILDFSVTGMPRIGQRLAIRRGGHEVAEVVVTGPQRDNQIAADIAHGVPRVGDYVREY